MDSGKFKKIITLLQLLPSSMPCATHLNYILDTCAKELLVDWKTPDSQWG